MERPAGSPTNPIVLPKSKKVLERYYAGKRLESPLGGGLDVLGIKEGEPPVANIEDTNLTPLGDGEGEGHPELSGPSPFSPHLRQEFPSGTDLYHPEVVRIQKVKIPIPVEGRTGDPRERLPLLAVHGPDAEEFLCLLQNLFFFR